MEKSKVIWAVDPRPHEKKTQFSTFKALAGLTAGTDWEIEPVTVLSPDQRRVPLAAFRAGTKEYRLEAETVLLKWCKELKHPRLIAPTLVSQDFYSANRSIDELLKYARDTKAKIIGIATHTKKAWEKFLVGSFAETMMLKSEIPLLVVNPKHPLKGKISTIFFPTDFTQASETAFDTLLPIAKALKAKVVLYYKFDYVTPDTMALIKADERYAQYLKDDLEEYGRKSKAWVDKASAAGVKVSVVLDKDPFFVAAAVLKGAKKSKAGLIAMASSSGAAGAALLGSVARHVVRAAEVPVWVIHPEKPAKRAGSSADLPAKGSIRIG